mmetsp:Transcript_57938/g.66128  ORF Transcript_57938/g.66128 Transcript_57938/m.66128 type:complete len:97 (-) Transcript_57938:1280-1570(-)
MSTKDVKNSPRNNCPMSREMITHMRWQERLRHEQTTKKYRPKFETTTLSSNRQSDPGKSIHFSLLCFWFYLWWYFWPLYLSEGFFSPHPAPPGVWS